MTDTATNAPATNEAPATPDAAPFGELSDFEHALGNVLRALSDLDEDDTRRVLLAVSELYDLNLWHSVPSSDPLIRVSSAVKLIEMPARVAGMRAREKAPSWVREALAGVGEQRRAG